MSCPTCKGTLDKKKLAEHLLGQSCTSCEGVLLTLKDYLYYLSRSDAVDEDLSFNEDETVLDEDTSSAIICNCGQIMSKYRISHNTDRRIDCCSACQSIWLDNGEWEYLKVNNLHRLINKIFTDVHQRNIRLEGTRVTLGNNYKRILGVSDYNILKELRNWIDSNKNKSTILAYLNTNDPYSA